MKNCLSEEICGLKFRSRDDEKRKEGREEDKQEGAVNEITKE